MQSSSKLGTDGMGNFVVVWRDYRLNHGDNDYYCQIFNSNAQRIGNNFRINQLATTWGGYIDIAVRKNGSFIVCWSDTLVRLKIYNSIGIPISSEIIVNNVSYSGSGGLAPATDCDTMGNFVVVWRKPLPNGGINIQFQRFDSLGNKTGSDIKVNEDTANNGHDIPDISIRKDGSFIIVWKQQYGSSWWEFNTIHMQMFDKNGIKTGNNILVYNKTDSIDQQNTPIISSDDLGRFCIGFTNYDFSVGDFDALFQMYNTNGTMNGGPVYVDVSSYDEFFRTIFKRKNGDFIIGYHKEFSPGPLCQRYNSSGQTIGTPFLLSEQTHSSGKYYDDVAIYNDKIISIWSDQRNGADGDIYCNIRSFLKPDSIITNINNLTNAFPNYYYLYQNYPNPFNNSTIIKYQVSKPGNDELGATTFLVSIKITDLLGKELYSLVDEKKSRGTYEIKFDGSNLSTGLYFYTLYVNGLKTDTKKFILMK